MEVSSCCICLKSAPVLYKITEKVNDDETFTPIYKLLLCVPDINWLQNSQICSSCKDNLDKTYDFRQMCYKSEFSRCEIKIEDQKVEKLDDGFSGALKIEPISPVDNTRVPNVCNICSKSTENLSKISEMTNERNVSPILKLKILIQNIDWSDDFDICTLCEEGLNKAYDFRELCFRNQCNNLAIESKQIKVETIDIENIKIESSEHPTKIRRSNILKCEHCKKIVKSNEQLRLHLAKEHTVEAEETLKHECHLCSKRFLLLVELKRHLGQVHLNISDFKCEQCDQEFKLKRFLQRHLAKVHKVGVEETLRHECHLCSKRFSLPNELRRHLRQVHLNICDFKCEQCGKEFKSKPILESHLAKVHKVGVNETLSHKCHVCSKRFLLLMELKRHFREVHLPISNFKCENCSKEFKSNRMLKIHLAIVHKIGIEERLKHECQLCLERFLTPSKLKRHLDCRRCRCLKKCSTN